MTCGLAANPIILKAFLPATTGRLKQPLEVHTLRDGNPCR